MIPLTRHGFREMLIGSVVLAGVGTILGFVWLPLSLLVLPVLIWLFAFFRDPERPITTEQNAMVSPADGKVSDITPMDDYELLGGPCLRVGIFLSVFNVHVNRSPCDGKISQVTYKTGKFINAMNHRAASDDNESNTVLILDPSGSRPVAVVKQIVGLIARRIICTVAKGDGVTRGQRIGMIKFGSRTELYIPMTLEPRISVQVGQIVRGGADIIAVLGKPFLSTNIAEPATDEEFERIVPRETPA